MSKLARDTAATPRQVGAAAAWNPKLTEGANPYADEADRAQWLEGWNDTIRSREIALRRAELKGGSE